MSDTKESAKNMIVNIEQIQVNMIDSTSGIFVGETTATGWSSKYKMSTFFKINGNYNTAYQNNNIGFDNDLIDTYVG